MAGTAEELAEKLSMGVKTCQGTTLSRAPPKKNATAEDGCGHTSLARSQVATSKASAYGLDAVIRYWLRAG